MENQEATTEINTAPPSLNDQMVAIEAPKLTWEDHLRVVHAAFQNLRNVVNEFVPGNREKSIAITELETAEWRAGRAFDTLRKQNEAQAQKQN